VAYDTDWINANDEGLQKKVRVAMCATALAVLGESPSGTPNGPLHTKRHALGAAVLTDGGLAQLERFMFSACAGTGAITTASNDAAIDTRLSSIWSDLAGVMITDG
jgi:hypothetical protein